MILRCLLLNPVIPVLFALLAQMGALFPALASASVQDGHLIGFYVMIIILFVNEKKFGAGEIPL